MLRSLVADRPKQWDLALSQAEFAFNSMVNMSTKRAPFAIVYTKPPNHTTDLLKLPSHSSKSVEALADKITTTLEDVKLKLTEANAKYKIHADEHRREKVFHEGELVMIHLNKSRFPIGEYHKLQAKNFGPFRVKQRINDNSYIIDLPTGWNISSTFNVSDLYEYYPPDGITEAADHSRSSSFQEGETDAVAPSSSVIGPHI